MSAPGTVVAGALLGLLLGTGLALIAGRLPWLRQRDLAARIDPYLRRSSASALLDSAGPRGRSRVVLEALLGPVAVRAIGVLERLTGVRISWSGACEWPADAAAWTPSGSSRSCSEQRGSCSGWQRDWQRSGSAVPAR